MSVIRVGSTGKYADGWESIFGGATTSGRRLKAAKKSGGAARKTAKTARAKPAAKTVKKVVKKAGKKAPRR